MNSLHRKLYEASRRRENVTTTYNGFTFREIEDFENAIIEVHSVCRENFEKTNNMQYANVALDCLKTINDMEKIKDRIIMK